MPAAPSFQSIATFDTVVGPHSDDFGPYTSGTVTSGLQEALTAAGDGGSVFVRSGTYLLHKNLLQKGSNQLLMCEPGVTLQIASDWTPLGLPSLSNALLNLGWDGATDRDGFIFEGNGCLLDGANLASPSVTAMMATGVNREVFRFLLRGFRAQNFVDYGVAIGNANAMTFSGSAIGLVTVENFDIFNSGWLRPWGAEHVRFRHGRCRQIANNVNLDGWFVTSQHSTAGTRTTRDIVFDDILGDATGSGSYDTTLEIQGSAYVGFADVTRDILFRRCYLKGRNSGDWYIDDEVNATGSALVESVTFEDCTFDSMASQSPAGRIVSNTSEGYVVFDHCEFINGANLPTTSYLAGSVFTRPVIVRRPVSTVTYPNQNLGIAVGASPFTFTNTHRYVMVVLVSGGTVTKIEMTPRGGAAVTTGETKGVFYLSEGDAVRVTYTSLPTMTGAAWY